MVTITQTDTIFITDAVLAHRHSTSRRTVLTPAGTFQVRGTVGDQQDQYIYFFIASSEDGYI
jgi:hypothetical protein